MLNKCANNRRFQIQEDDEDGVEVFLTYNCSSHLHRLNGSSTDNGSSGSPVASSIPHHLGKKQQSTESSNGSVIEWNRLPLHVVCAFPYLLSVTDDAIEFRSAVNGALLQNTYLPELKLISTKVRCVLGRWLLSGHFWPCNQYQSVLICKRK